jgi:hypothetical protein
MGETCKNQMTLTLIHKIKSIDKNTCQIDRKPLSIACLSKGNSIRHTPATYRPPNNKLQLEIGHSNTQITLLLFFACEKSTKK